jgi:predicted methyltransferase
MYRRIRVVAVGAVLAVSCAGAATDAADKAPAYIADALRSVERPPVEFTRDEVLKPATILQLSGIRPGMVAVDLRPDSGYYMRLLSEVVGSRGHVYAVVPQSNHIGGVFGLKPAPLAPDNVGSMREPTDRITGSNYQPNIGRNTDVMVESVDGKQSPNDVRYGNFAVPRQIDVLISAYDYHAFKGPDFSDTSMENFLGAIYRSMNNGGRVVIVDNAADPAMPLANAVALNRIDPGIVKRELTAAGFVLEQESSVLAKADDDHRSVAEDVIVNRTAKAADAFVLVFRKPTNAPNTNRRPPDSSIAGLFGNTLELFEPADSVHLLHADHTYQEIRGRTYAAGIWFFNADGWHCRYRPRASIADCATSPHEYEHKVGDVWDASHGRYRVLKGYRYDLILPNVDKPLVIYTGPPGTPGGPPAPGAPEKTQPPASGSSGPAR